MVGCGYFGQIQLEAWRRMPEVEMVAACDLNVERARSAAPHAYARAEEMLERERLDFVDIATRVEAHPELLRLATARKLPVICQKPLAPNWDEAVAMVHEAEAAGIPFMVHENWRWQPWYRAAKESIERGDIGQPLGYWFRTRHRDGLGPAPYPKQSYFRQLSRFLIDEALVHHMDTARFLFGDVAAICAQTRRVNPAIRAEDQAILILRHDDGLLGSIDGHRFLNPEPDGPALGEAAFEGDRGVIYVSATGDVYQGTRKIWANEVQEGYRGDSVRATQQHFIRCLQTGEPFESGGREYLKTVAAVEAAYRSVAEQRTVCLDEFHCELAPEAHAGWTRGAPREQVTQWEPRGRA